jgi:hypothetical protein
VNTFQESGNWLNAIKGRLWATVAQQPMRFVAVLTMLLGLGWGIAAVAISEKPATRPLGAQSTTGSSTSTGTLSAQAGAITTPTNLGGASQDPAGGPGSSSVPPVKLKLSPAAPEQPFPLPTEATSAGLSSEEFQSFFQGVHPAVGGGNGPGLPGTLALAFDGGTPQVTAMSADAGSSPASPNGAGAGGSSTGTTGSGNTPGSTTTTPSNITSPVPEPSTGVLMALGLGLGLATRRRRGGRWSRSPRRP